MGQELTNKLELMMESLTSDRICDFVHVSANEADKIPPPVTRLLRAERRFSEGVTTRRNSKNFEFTTNAFYILICFINRVFVGL